MCIKTNQKIFRLRYAITTILPLSACFCDRWCHWLCSASVTVMEINETTFTLS